MKTIGLIGGMSWESTVGYYQQINRAVQQQLGGVHSAKILLHSYDFAEIAWLQQQGRWDEAAALLASTGQSLVRAGADMLAICCNTMHLMAEQVEREAGVPLVHIADPLGAAARAAGMTRLGLIGSRFTMEESRIISRRLRERFGVEVVVPDAADRSVIDGVIQTELVKGIFSAESRRRYRAIMAGLTGAGCEAIILGCTEIPLLVNEEDAQVPLFDTLRLHAAAIAAFALA